MCIGHKMPMAYIFSSISIIAINRNEEKKLYKSKAIWFVSYAQRSCSSNAYYVRFFIIIWFVSLVFFFFISVEIFEWQKSNEWIDLNEYAYLHLIFSFPLSLCNVRLLKLNEHDIWCGLWVKWKRTSHKFVWFISHFRL